ncbi:phage virion morphogenesis protein [bacterium]|nr:phage virion morphogenesis protein [bacterium]
MGQVTLSWEDQKVQEYLNLLGRSIERPYELMGILGQLMVTFTSEHFQQHGPGWQPKSPLFAEWEGGKTAPLTYTGNLERSVDYEILGLGAVRVGTNLEYAATQQWGTSSPRWVCFWIQVQKGPDGKTLRWENGYPHGVFVPRRKGQDPPDGVEAVYMRINIEPREFIRDFDFREKQRIESASQAYLSKLGRAAW